MMRRRFGLKRFGTCIIFAMIFMFVHELMMLQNMDHLLNNIQIGFPVNTFRQFYQPDVEALTEHRFPGDNQSCTLCQEDAVPSDLQMYKVLTQSADMSLGGWGQSLTPKNYNKKQLEETRFHVIVVPHSHCDPGWLKTFDEYHQNHTRLILNNMVKKLEEHRNMTFIYSEMSFFQKWWSEISQHDKQKVRQYLTEGRLEIPAAGWVMPDEANSHYYALVDQLLEGHQWARNELGIVPHNGWAIDPFGHSPTMAYIHQNAGLNNILIQRIHYAIKQYLASEQNFEFNWRQNWDPNGYNDIFTHMMPYSHYDHLNTCGPDAGTCCQYDFRRQPGWITCSGQYVTPVDQSNVKAKTERILDMYRRKGSLYRSGVVLVPLGDDFRYMTEIEWDQQYENYLKIMEYIDDHPEYNAKVQFGTLSDYFKAVREHGGTHYGPMTKGYPTLAGDFFSYADMGDSYWTGYFTSRPFQKKLDRVLEYHLRSAEVIYSLALIQSRQYGIADSHPLMTSTKLLVTARRSLGLFQHHDGITGTAKDHVVVDYGKRMLEGILNSKRVIQNSAVFLLGAGASTLIEDRMYFDLDELIESHDAIPERYVLDIKTARKVTFYNSLSQDRVTVVSIYVTSPNVEIFNHQNREVVTIQISPFFDTLTSIVPDKYKLSFLVDVPALSLSTYTINPTELPKLESLAAVTLVNMHNIPIEERNYNNTLFSVQESSDDFSIKNDNLKVAFDKNTGLAQTVQLLKANITQRLELQFSLYSARGGAYLFLPTGKSQALDDKDKPQHIRVTKGPLFEEVRVYIKEIEHIVTLYKSPGIDGHSIEIYNIVDIREHSNKELAMTVKTDIENKKREFYTDLNGFQMQKRKYMSRMPLQGNFYPMTSMMFIQDNSTRVTLTSAQSGGVTCQETGLLEVILDRRLIQDDYRGLEQGVKDNKRTPNKFRILIETITDNTHNHPDKPIAYPSLQAHFTHEHLISPIFHLPHKVKIQNQTDIKNSSESYLMSNLKSQYTAMSSQLPCEVDIFNLRSLPNSEDNPEKHHLPRQEIGLTLHRKGVDCRFPLQGATCDLNNIKIALTSLFSRAHLSTAKLSSLTFLHDQPISDLYEYLDLKPMTLNTYKLLYR